MLNSVRFYFIAENKNPAPGQYNTENFKEKKTPAHTISGKFN